MLDVFELHLSRDDQGVRPSRRQGRLGIHRARRIMIALAAVATVAGAPAAGAQTAADVNGTLDTLFGGHAPYQAFFDALKKAVSTDDRKGVAAMVSYPFRARINGKAVKLNDADHFVADYDKIVTTKVKDAVTKQTYATLFANWQGVSIGDGEIWFSGVGTSQAIKITAIND